MKNSPAANLLTVSKKAAGLFHLVLNPRSSGSTGIIQLSMFSMRTYLPASIARITLSMASSVPWISMVTLPSHSFLTQPVQPYISGTIAESDALDPAIEGDVLAKHILHIV